MYTTTCAQIFQPMLDECPHVVQKATNEALLEPITIEEVKRAIFQIVPTKTGPQLVQWIIFSTSLEGYSTRDIPPHQGFLQIT